MNKLWVYGCSFSEPFGLVSYTHGMFDSAGNRNLYGAEYWGTHLAEKLNVECITRSIAGVGWNYINDKIDEDILKWSKDDYIIISPSFFTRVTYEELIKRDSQTELTMQMRDCNFTFNYNESRWRRKIETLQYFSYRVYTWLVDETPNASQVKSLITVDGNVNWKVWLDQHKEYWIDPDFNPPHGDWHFNSIGHVAAADAMYKFIAQ